MPLTYNGNTPSAVTYNGNPVSEVTYNGVTVWSAAPSYPPYLTFSSLSAFSLINLCVAIGDPAPWDGTMEYSTDKSTWATWNGSTINAANADGAYYLYLRGSGNTIVSGADEQGFSIASTAPVSCSGDIRTLLDYADPENSAMADSCFESLFSACTTLLSAPDLPAETLPSRCYRAMFANCTSLIEAPKIGATSATGTALYNMFVSCTALIQLPAIHITSFSGNVCNGMFRNCSLIKISETQTGEYQTPYRIPMEGTATGATAGTTGYMFYATGGTFTGNPTINTTYYTSNTIVS